MFATIIEKYRYSTYARVAILASIAAVLSFSIGSNFTQTSAIVAAITAIISIRPTFHDAAQEAFRQIVGTLLGAGTAFGLTILFDGFNSLVLLAALLVGFLSARIMKLGEGGAITIAVTVILVTGVNMNTDDVETRFLGVLLGAFVALPFSYYTSAGTPASRAIEKISKYSDTLARILDGIGESTSSVNSGKILDSVSIQNWMQETEKVRVGLAEVKKDVESAIGGYRWSPSINKDEVENILRQLHIAESSTDIVLAMCKDLLILSEKTEPLPAYFYNSFSGFVESLADAVEEQAVSAKNSPAQLLPKESTIIENLNVAEFEMKKQLRSLDETMPLFLGGALLQDGVKLKQVLSNNEKDKETS